jgi:hypothetical protein
MAVVDLNRSSSAEEMVLDSLFCEVNEGVRLTSSSNTDTFPRLSELVNRPEGFTVTFVPTQSPWTEVLSTLYMTLGR